MSESLDDATRTMLARIAHEANLAYCQRIGDDTQRPWDQAPQWQKDSALLGVDAVMAGKNPEELHAEWSKVKVAEGWVYGPVKDPAAKTHPCLVPYADLPAPQRVKDFLFRAVIRAAYRANAGDQGNY